MKTLLILGVLTATTSWIASMQSVYICNSANSKVYHLDRDCFALDRCTHEILKLSKQEAEQDYGRRLCGHED